MRTKPRPASGTAGEPVNGSTSLLGLTEICGPAGGALCACTPFTCVSVVVVPTKLLVLPVVSVVVEPLVVVVPIVVVVASVLVSPLTSVEVVVDAEVVVAGAVVVVTYVVLVHPHGGFIVVLVHPQLWLTVVDG